MLVLAALAVTLAATGLSRSDLGAPTVAALVLVTTVVATYVASMGASWFAFQHLLGYPPLAVSTPLLAFLFLVALGVDYNIFLTTRAREEAAGGSHARESIVTALAVTGGVITSAGILLAAVFAVLGVLPLVQLAQIGVIVGFGVIATISALALGAKLLFLHDSRPLFLAIAATIALLALVVGAVLVVNGLQKSVGPPQATAGDRPETQVRALDAARETAQLFALYGALSRIDVADRDRSVLNERADFRQGAAEYAGDVRLLVFVGEGDRFAKVVFFEELRELGGELAGLSLRFLEIPPLLDRD